MGVGRVGTTSEASCSRSWAAPPALKEASTGEGSGRPWMSRSSSSDSPRYSRFGLPDDLDSPAPTPTSAISPGVSPTGNHHGAAARKGGWQCWGRGAVAGAAVGVTVAAGLWYTGHPGGRLADLPGIDGCLAAWRLATQEAASVTLVPTLLVLTGVVSSVWVGVRARRHLKRLANLSNLSPFQINGRSTSVDEKMIEYLQSNYGADGVQTGAQQSTAATNGRTRRDSFSSIPSSRQPSLRRSVRRCETEKSWFDYMTLDAATRPEHDASSSSSSSSCADLPMRGMSSIRSPRADSAELVIAHAANCPEGRIPCDPASSSTRLKELAFRMPSWNFDVFEVEALAPRPLSFIGFVCLDAYSKLVDFHKPKLLEFLNDVESSYRKVPYHNSLHAACVARMVYSFCTGCGLSFSQENMEFTLILAGLVHDVNHPGLSAPFLTHASAGGRPWNTPPAPPLEAADMDIASKYNDQSPLENMHCAVTFELLRREKNAFLKPEDVTNMRRPLIRAILGTDMAKHAEHMTRLVALIDNLEHDAGGIPWYWPATPPAGSNEEQRKAWQLRLQEEFVMELFLHAADIGNSTLPFTQWCKWNRLIQQEFHNQGDLEMQEFGELISAPAGYDRRSSSATQRHFNKGFMEYLVKPFFDRLGDLTAITAAGCVAGKVNIQCCLGNLRRNLRQWDERTSLERGSQWPPDSPPRCSSAVGDKDRWPLDDQARDDISLGRRSRRLLRRNTRPLAHLDRVEKTASGRVPCVATTSAPAE